MEDTSLRIVRLVDRDIVVEYLPRRFLQIHLDAPTAAATAAAAAAASVRPPTRRFSTRLS